MPMQQLSKQVGLSDVGIAKAVRKVGIPVPPRGYWAKVEAGKPVAKIPLPVREIGESIRVTVSGQFASVLRPWGGDETGLQMLEFEDIESMMARYKKRVGKVTVPRDFSKAVPAIRKLLEKDEQHRIKKQTERFYWREPVFDSPFERRRLRILNALLLAVYRVGGSAWIRGEDAREHSLTIGNVGLTFTLDRADSRKGQRAAQSKEVEKLRLSLSLYDAPANIETTWTDKPDSPLESQMTGILIDMGVAAEKIYRHRIAESIERERQRRIEIDAERRRQEEEAQRRDQERLAALRQAKRDTLVADASAFEQAKTIRLYVDAVAASVPDPASRDFVEWARWAREEADRLDPIASGRAAAVIDDHLKD